LQTFSFESFKDMDITPYQVYSLDLDYQQFYSIQNYIKDPTDIIDKDQQLNILFLDIEVFMNHSNVNLFKTIEQAKFQINAITTYSTFEKIYRAYILLQHVNVQKFPGKDEIHNLIQAYVKDLADEKYIKPDEKLEVYVFTNEIDLIRSCWSKIREIDPTVLSGWNSDKFDIPYIYFRLSNLLNKNDVEIGKILSRFGKIKLEKFNNEFLIKIPEFPVLDLLYAYKPREDNGLVN